MFQYSQLKHKFTFAYIKCRPLERHNAQRPACMFPTALFLAGRSPALPVTLRAVVLSLFVPSAKV